MKTAPIVPARWRFDEPDGPPFSLEDDDLYHPRAGALVQARHVFLAGNGLPERWRGRERFVVLETGFGLGNNFLATWHAWRQDPNACRRLHFISIERHPLTRVDLMQVHRDSTLRALADALIAAWPPLTPNLHRLGFDGGRVQLLLALGDVGAWLPELTAQVDAFFLDGFAPARNPSMWQARLFKAMARLAAPGATAATWTASQAVRAGLKTAGFDVQLAAGTGGKRDITLARFEPPFQARRAIDARRSASCSAGATQRALVVGAGLAGCAAAWALAEQGWKVTVLDRHALPAQEASGNPAGLFHGIFNLQDGAHARFNRAAALETQRVVQQAIAEQGVLGRATGLLRLEPSQAGTATMDRQLAASGLPIDYVQVVSAAQASALCGMPLQHPAWFYPGGGWVAPGPLARALLARAGAAATFRGDIDVQAIHRSVAGWELRDARGELIAAAQTLVLANAFDALRLLGSPAWPVQKVRGQISLWPAAAGAALPTLPLTGAGYLLPVVDSLVAFGATSQAGDDDASVRRSDHEHNLAQLARLCGSAFAQFRPEDLQGRTAWRMVSSDRLPIVGAVPDPAALDAELGRRLDQPRFVPRLPGLFVFTALGSRGITWAALGAQSLASSITGAPQPLESVLLDAIDPARFITRAVRHSSRRD
jgi:tRNA 5-methylaminomethyl-2-thiouridine biosynthesis bifunctional protein